MPGEDDKKQPDPVEDLKKGFGLLFRAAKSAVDQLPTDKLEKVVVTGVREVGRAIENVTDQIDRQIFHGKGTIPHPEDANAAAKPPNADPAAATPPDASAAPQASASASADSPKPDAAAPIPASSPPAPPAGDDEPRGPRIA